jgi:hypothetical protein
MTTAVGTANPGESGRIHRVLAFLKRAWVPLVLMLASLAMSVTVTASHSHALSPVDEWVYIDYLYKLPSQGIIRQGEELGPEALELMACSGEKVSGPMGPACDVSQVGDHVDPALFPYSGLQSAYGYTPLYFAPTWAVAKGIQAVTGADLLTAARFTGPLWLVGTMLLFSALFREFKVNRVTTAAIGLAFIGSPFAWWTYTYISTDIPAVGVSALLLLATRRYLTGRWSGWWVVLISVAAVLFKTGNVLAVALAALYLVSHFVFSRIRSRSSSQRMPVTLRDAVRGRGDLGALVIALASVVASGIALGAWQLIQRAAAIGPSSDQGLGAPLTLQDLATQVTNFLPGTIVSNVPGGPGIDAYAIPSLLTAPLSWLCIAGVVGALLTLRRGSEHLGLAYSVGIAAVAAAPLLAVFVQLTLGFYFDLPSRYGAPILIGFLLMAGVVAQRNFFARWVLLAYGAGLVAFAIVSAHGYAR